MVQINPTKYVWMDGRFVRWKSAKLHVMTHALLYGSAVFEGIRSYEIERGTSIFRVDEHLDRLLYSAKSLGMKTKFSKSQLKNAVKKLAKLNKLGDAYIRPMAYYGYGDIGVYPKNSPTKVMIISMPWKKYFSKNLRVMVSKYIRHAEKSSVFGVKISGNYANSILAMHEARSKGYDEALMLDYKGHVSEGPAENLFLVKNSKLITPGSRSALHGITRDTILKLSRDIGLDASEKQVTLNEVKNADELFYCGTMMEIAPIVSLNGIKIGNGKVGQITSEIKDKFYDVVRGRDNKYKKWLAYID